MEPFFYVINALVGFGITFLVRDSLILAKPRKYLVSKSKFLESLLHCSFCTGIWVGALLSAFSFLSFPCTTFGNLITRSLYVTFIVAVSSYYLDLKTREMEEGLDK